MRVRVTGSGGCLGTVMARIPSKGSDKMVSHDSGTPAAARVLGQEPKHWRGDQGLSDRLEAGWIDKTLGSR